MGVKQEPRIRTHKQKLKWEEQGIDDWKAINGQWMLRAEKMGEGLWWWNVSYDGKEVTSSWYESWATTFHQAKTLCSYHYRKHKLSLIREKHG
jgi:hypothetical protein